MYYSYQLLIPSVNSLSLYKVGQIKTTRFGFQNGSPNISGMVYRYEMFLYAKRIGGLHLSDHLKQRTVVLTRAKASIIFLLGS